MATGETLPSATVEGIGADQAEALGEAPRPVRDVSERVRQDALLPAALHIAANLGGPEALDDPDVIRQRWKSGRPLHVTVGATGSGPLTLDIRLDGPHALVAGTPGAGKSEFLQSLIVSMAASMSPEQVTFLLVD
jgi:S-DNA-T family DNA segregation ATPase FtsK/SpoIIIE